MTPDDPRHGSYRGWAQHDRDGEKPCDPCLDARRAYNRVTPHLKSIGRAPRVPVGERGHVIVLELADLTEREWRDHTGLSAVTRRRIIQTGPATTVRRTTQQQILALNPAQVRAGLLTVIGTIRRIQALACLGHSATSIADRAGFEPETIRKIQGGDLDYVEYATRERIAAVYAELEHHRLRVDRITARTFNLAERSKWHAPAAWDAIDDPAETPLRPRRGRSRSDVDQAVVERAMAYDFTPHSTPAERIEITRRWEADGRSLSELERLTGWKSNRYTTREDGAA